MASLLLFIPEFQRNYQGTDIVDIETLDNK
jgi:hypothetical protein